MPSGRAPRQGFDHPAGAAVVVRELVGVGIEHHAVDGDAEQVIWTIVEDATGLYGLERRADEAHALRLVDLHLLRRRRVRYEIEPPSLRALSASGASSSWPACAHADALANRASTRTAIVLFIVPHSV
jgi:hypothetical protein